MMDEHNESGILRNPTVAKLAVAFLVAATALVTIQAFSALSNFYESPSGQQDTITVSGEGKVSAPPDIATISFVVSENSATVAAAQTAAAKDTNAALAALGTFSIASADIQTSSYDVYPQYASATCGAVVPGSGAALPCVYNGNPGTIIGYTASQTVTVTVRNLNSVGAIVTALGKANVSNINGPNFSIDNPDAVDAQARALAIADARTQANTLAGELGVHILRVVSYSEGNNNGPVPLMAAVSSANGGSASVVPSVPTGENDVVVDVSVTYEIH